MTTPSLGDPPPEPLPQGHPSGWQAAGPDAAGEHGTGGVHLASGEPSIALPMGMDPSTPLHQPGWYDPMTNSYWPMAPAPWAPAPTMAPLHATPSPIAFAPAATLPQLPNWQQQPVSAPSSAILAMAAMAPSAAPELATSLFELFNSRVALCHTS